MLDGTTIFLPTGQDIPTSSVRELICCCIKANWSGQRTFFKSCRRGRDLTKLTLLVRGQISTLEWQQLLAEMVHEVPTWFGEPLPSARLSTISSHAHNTGKWQHWRGRGASLRKTKTWCLSFHPVLRLEPPSGCSVLAQILSERYTMALWRRSAHCSSSRQNRRLSGTHCFRSSSYLPKVSLQLRQV